MQLIPTLMFGGIRQLFLFCCSRGQANNKVCGKTLSLALLKEKIFLAT